MKTMRMWAAGAALISVAGLGSPIAAQASAEGSKNTAIALGAAVIFELVKHKTTEALVLGAGAAVAAKQSSDARKKENKRNGRYYYDSYGNDANTGQYNRDRQNSNSGPYYRGSGNSGDNSNQDYQYQDNQYRGDQQNSGDGDYDRNDSAYNYGNQNNQDQNYGNNQYNNSNWDSNGNSSRPNVYCQSGSRGGDNQDFRHMSGANRSTRSGQWNGPSVRSLQNNSR